MTFFLRLSALLTLLMLPAPFDSFADYEVVAPDQPSRLVDEINDYCGKASPPAPALVEHVNGFFYDCASSLSSCVRPLIAGYSFVEFEYEQRGRRSALPSGTYRAELTDRSDARCTPFLAATLDTPANISATIARSGKCVALTKIAATTAKYKMAVSYQNRRDDAPTTVTERYQIIRLADDKVVAEARATELRFFESGAELRCDLKGDRDLYRIVIPPRVFEAFK